MEAKSIKNILEVVAGLKVLAVGGKKIMADGKISIADLSVAMDLLRQINVLNAAIADIEQVIPEAKDLSAAEAEQVVNAILLAVKEIKAA